MEQNNNESRPKKSWFEYTDDFGNTTGYGSNGNFYSANTDHLGNTTSVSFKFQRKEL